MPLIFSHNPIPGTKLAVWQISEAQEALLQLVLLNSHDHITLRSYCNELRRNQWIAARILVQILMYPEKPGIIYDEQGKPSFVDNLSHLSISHSSCYVSVLISDKHRCGVDIEVPRDKILRVADRFISAAELGQTQEPDRMNKLIVHWCAKEALYKMSGIPGLDLQNEIILSRFDYLCGAWGTCRGSIRYQQRTLVYPLHFRVEPDFMLAFALDQEYTDDEKEPEV